jgi:hypothetical protein
MPHMDTNATMRGGDERSAQFSGGTDEGRETVVGSPIPVPHGADEADAGRLCTVCGHALSEHTFDRSSTHDHYMYCPVTDRLPDPNRSSVPVNEFGMALVNEDPDAQ